jgi:hypothetical protein
MPRVPPGQLSWAHKDHAVLLSRMLTSASRRWMVLRQGRARAIGSLRSSHTEDENNVATHKRDDIVQEVSLTDCTAYCTVIVRMNDMHMEMV